MTELSLQGSDSDPAFFVIASDCEGFSPKQERSNPAFKEIASSGFALLAMTTVGGPAMTRGRPRNDEKRVGHRNDEKRNAPAMTELSLQGSDSVKGVIATTVIASDCEGFSPKQERSNLAFKEIASSGFALLAMTTVGRYLPIISLKRALSKMAVCSPLCSNILQGFP